MSTTAWSKLKLSPRETMTRAIARCPIRWATWSGCRCATAHLHPSVIHQRESCASATMRRIASPIKSMTHHPLVPSAKCRIHDVFHAEFLKHFVGSPPVVPPQLPPIHHGAAIHTPHMALKVLWSAGFAKSWRSGPRNQHPRHPRKTSMAVIVCLAHKLRQVLVQWA